LCIFLYFSSRWEDRIPQNECFEWMGVKIRHYFSSYFFKIPLFVIFVRGCHWHSIWSNSAHLIYFV
jgi:hypothetical protein